MNSLFGKTLSELEALAAKQGQPPYRAKQIAEWMYKKHVCDPTHMTNLPQDFREALSRRYMTALPSHERVAESDDGTKKYLFPAGEDMHVETAVIPDGERRTLCLSTQVGCRRGCTFCMTGRQKWRHDLSAGEMLNQYTSLPERDSITNIVYMGMGEPFDNTDAVLQSIEVFTAEWGYAMSPYRITVSTVGIMPGMLTYIDACRCHLAISIHNAIPEERVKLVPAEKQYPIREIVDAICSRSRWGRTGVSDPGYKNKIEHQRRLTFEYVMIKGVNDTLQHAEALAELLKNVKCRINLIRMNSIRDTRYEKSNEIAVNEFAEYVSKCGLFTSVRKSKGEEISAACGMLWTNKKSI